MLEITRKQDLLIPFVKIGDPGWEINTRAILEAIADNYGEDLKAPVTADELLALETRLGTSLPASLKLFYQTFGVANVGEQLQELADMGWLQDIWVAQPQYGPDFTEADKQYLPFLVSFSDYLGNGNIFCFHSETKEIYYFDHDTRPYLSRLFDDAGEYLKGCLIFAQVDLSRDDQAEAWARELVATLVPEAIIKKWQG